VFDICDKMPVQASNRLFKLFYRTDRLEVYPYANRLEVYRTDKSGVYPLGLSVRCELEEVPYRQVILLEASLTVLLRYLY
jgi:hypothetical protein